MPSGAPQTCRTNSPQSPAAVPARFEVVEVGFDTVSLAWRPEDPAIWEHIAKAERAKELTAGDPFAMPVVGTDGVAAPRIGLKRDRDENGRLTGGYRTAGHIAGVPWIFNRRNHLIYLEGRLACILDDNKDAVGLPSPAMLEHAAFLATFLLAPFGILLDPDAAVVRRCDTTGRIRFPDPKDGQDLQRALRDHGAESPEVRGRGAVTESVLWRGGRNRIAFISYDEGIRRGTYAPGEMIRLEGRHRPDKPKQARVPEFLQQDLGALWLDTFDRRTAGVPPLGSSNDAQAVIEQHIADGDLSAETGTRLQGSIERLERGGYALWGEEKLSQDQRRRLVRELARWGVETVAPPRRRGAPWSTMAHCRPTGGVIQVDDVSRCLRAAMADVRAAEQAGSSHESFASRVPRVNAR